MSRLALLATSLAVAAFAVAGCGAQGTAPSPDETDDAASGFVVGLVSDDAFAAQGVDRVNILRRQRSTGVRQLRQTFDWSTIEREPRSFDFAYHDEYVAAAASAGLEILPILFNPPSFHSPGGRRAPGEDTPPPKSLDSMERFARTLVRRYGRDGSLWRERPDVPRRPIRSWQVWNEPNVPAYWGGDPSAKEYAAMVRRVGGAIKAVDARAEIVSGGIPDSQLGIPFEPYVRQLDAAGAIADFDTLAIHPYARTPDGVLAAIAGARRLLTGLGHPKTKLWVTEFGWATDGPSSPFTVGPQLQGDNLRTVIAELGRRAPELGVRGAVYYNWRDARPYPGGRDFWGLHTGLVRRDGTAKPALVTFTEAIAQLPEAPD